MEWITASLTTNNRTLAKTRDLESMSFLLTIFLSTLEFGLLFNTFFLLNGDVIHRRRGKVSRYSSTRSKCQDFLLVDIPDG